MAVRVRLTRVGSKKNAMWRVVVADQRSPRDGRFIEMIGHYNPQTEPSQIVIDRDRLDHWLQMGARPSETVQKLMRAENSPPLTPKAPQAPEPAAASEPAASDAAAAEPAEAEPAAEEPAAASAEAEATPEAQAAPEGDAAAAPDAEAPEADASPAAAEGADAEAEAKTAGGEDAADGESG